MKERPIIFSIKMVQALLNMKPDVWPAERIDAGKPFKSMTRRAINPRYRKGEAGFQVCTNEARGERLLEKYDENEMSFDPPRYIEPIYLPGDILWVRETWNSITLGDGQKIPIETKYWYKADDTSYNPDNIWFSPLFMPRKAARIFLQIKNIRVERLQDINEEDARAEGIKSYWLHKEAGYGAEDWHESSNPPFVGVAKNPEDALCHTRRQAYQQLWDSLNAKRGYSWDSNPWVWVYEFMRIEKQEG